MDEIKDADQIKNEVLQKTAEYAFKNILAEKAEDIPFEIISGIKPQFRCCVYREREIIRQRVRLSMGQLPRDAVYTELEPTQVVHVIPCACEGCPIVRFTVTDNCQNCLTKKCIKSCAFGAISATKKGAYIDKQLCKKCGKCVASCPYHAIVDIERPCKKSCPVDAIEIDENDIAIIDSTKCINCGLCINNCPFGAISDVSMMTNVINTLLTNDNVYAMIAPAIEGQFGPDASIGVIKNWIKKLGFKDVYEVALGADAVAYREAEELSENFKNGKKMTSSCCPSFVNLISKYYGNLVENISTTISPMVATARLIREKDPEAVTVFIGPCVTKKNEALSLYIKEVNYVITFEELAAMFAGKNIDLSASECDENSATSYGKGFAKSGGVAAAVLKVLEEKGINEDIKILNCNGIDECKKALLMLKAGRLKEDFIEGMSCVHGCLGGPVNLKAVNESRKTFDKYQKNQNDNILKNNVSKKLDTIDIHKVSKN